MSIDKSDQEIQEALDQRLQNESDDEETKTYIALYEALNSLPHEDYLSSEFADNIVSKVKTSKKDSEAFWWFGSTIFFMILSGLMITVMMMGAMEIEVVGFISKYLPMMSLVTFVIVGVQWLDKRLVKLQV